MPQATELPPGTAFVLTKKGGKVHRTNPHQREPMQGLPWCHYGRIIEAFEGPLPFPRARACGWCFDKIRTYECIEG